MPSPTPVFGRVIRCATRPRIPEFERALQRKRRPADVPGPGGPQLALARVAPKGSGDRVAGALGLLRVGTSPDHRLLPVGEPFSARPTQACGPCLLVVVIPRRTSFTVGPTTSVTAPGTAGGRSVQRPHCSGPDAPHTLPHPDQAGCTERRRHADSPRSAHQLPGCRAQMRRLRSTVGLWRRTF